MKPTDPMPPDPSGGGDPAHIVPRRDGAPPTPGAPAPSVRVTVTESEAKNIVPMCLTLLKNAWSAWRQGEPIPGHEVLCMVLAFVYGFAPDQLIGEIIENPLRIIPDAHLETFLEHTGGTRIERLRPTPLATVPKFLQGAPIQVTNADVATVRVTMSETMWVQLQAITTFGLRMDEARGLLDGPDGPHRAGETKANAIAFVLGRDVSAEVLSGQVIEAPMMVLPDAQWWSFTDEQRGLLRVQRCDDGTPLAPLVQRRLQ
jgi:hypothetical protein